MREGHALLPWWTLSRDQWYQILQSQPVLQGGGQVALGQKQSLSDALSLSHSLFTVGFPYRVA